MLGLLFLHSIVHVCIEYTTVFTEGASPSTTVQQRP